MQPRACVGNTPTPVRCSVDGHSMSGHVSLFVRSALRTVLIFIQTYQETELLMPFPCDKCKRAGTICSGLEGQRCGRCRAIRKPCSHNAQPRPSRYKSDPPLKARFAVPVSSSTFVSGSVAASACGPEKDERIEEPNRRPESEKTMPGIVCETSSGMYPFSFMYT